MENRLENISSLIDKVTSGATDETGFITPIESPQIPAESFQAVSTIETANTNPVANPVTTGFTDPALATPSNESVALDATSAVVMGEMFMTGIMQLVARLMGLQATRKDFELTAKEKANLEPVVSQLLKKYMVNMSPEWKLVMFLGVMYGARIMVLPAITSEQKAEIKKGGKGRPVGSKNKPKE